MGMPVGLFVQLSFAGVQVLLLMGVVLLLWVCECVMGWLEMAAGCCCECCWLLERGLLLLCVETEGKGGPRGDPV